MQLQSVYVLVLHMPPRPVDRLVRLWHRVESNGPGACTTNCGLTDVPHELIQATVDDRPRQPHGEHFDLCRLCFPVSR
jgi:hypothetical protein